MAIFEVELIEAADFTEDHIEAYGWKPREDDYRMYLFVWYNGKIIRSESDGGEPEDNSFSRDWNWVGSAIEEAYQYGFKDGARL